MEREKNMSETPKEAQYIEIGDAGIGTIEAGPEQQERLDEFTERVGRGEFHTAIVWSPEFKKMILVRCVDGRVPETGANPLGPNSAGGTESLFVADDLTTRRFAAEDGSTAGGYANTVTFLNEAGYEVGGHTSDHAEGKASGCGANDNLPAIYECIATNPDVLRDYARILGVTVPDDIHQHIVGNARTRSKFSHGRELLETLQQTAKAAFVDNLTGNHHEVLTVINKKAGTTLDRDALMAEFGENYQAFNVDAWAFEAAARAISGDDEAEVAQKVVALLYYNLATALVLSGPSMRVVVTE